MTKFLPLSSLLLPLVACGTVQSGSQYDDGSTSAISAIDDLDGNGVEDYGNQSYAFGSTEIGAALGFFFSETLPTNSEGESYDLFGSGHEEYVTADNGWDTAFLQLPEMIDSDGRVVGYGAQGIRDGEYFANCGLSTAVPHETTGWCRPDQGLTPDDDTGWLVSITNGGPDCAGMVGYDSSGYRTSYAWHFMVQGGRMIQLGGSNPTDPNCYEQ